MKIEHVLLAVAAIFIYKKSKDTKAAVTLAPGLPPAQADQHSDPMPPQSTPIAYVSEQPGPVVSQTQDGFIQPTPIKRPIYQIPEQGSILKPLPIFERKPITLIPIQGPINRGGPSIPRVDYIDPKTGKTHTAW